jgi:hypothetical protein
MFISWLESHRRQLKLLLRVSVGAAIFLAGTQIVALFLRGSHIPVLEHVISFLGYIIRYINAGDAIELALWTGLAYSIVTWPSSKRWKLAILMSFVFVAAISIHELITRNGLVILFPTTSFYYLWPPGDRSSLGASILMIRHAFLGAFPLFALCLGLVLQPSLRLRVIAVAILLSSYGFYVILALLALSMF